MTEVEQTQLGKASEIRVPEDADIVVAQVEDLQPFSGPERTIPYRWDVGVRDPNLRNGGNIEIDAGSFFMSRCSSIDRESQHP